jgi:WD40 repeat protein
MTRYTRPPLYLWRLLAYDMATGQLLFDHTKTDRISAMALSSDGRSLAYSLVDSSEICVDDVASGSERWRRNAGLGVVRTIEFSPDDRSIAIGGNVSSLMIVNADDGSSADALVGQESSVNEVAWDPSTGQIFSGGSAGDLRHWHRDGPRKIRTFHGFFSVSFSTQPLCVSDDGRYFCAPTSKNALLWGAIDSAQPLATGLIGQSPLGFDHDSKGLSAIDEKDTLIHYRLGDQGKIRVESMTPLLNPDTGLEDARWSADHKALVLAGRDGSVNFFNLETGTHSSVSGFRRGAIGWANISADGTLAITGGVDDTVRLWLVKSGTLSREWSTASIPFHAAFSPDKSFTAICFRNGEVEIRGLPNGQIVKRYKSDLSVLESVAFLPDGKRLFLGGSNGGVQVLDCLEWRPLVTLSVSDGPDAGDRTIARLAVSAAGTTLMAYRADGWLTAWHYSAGSL